MNISVAIPVGPSKKIYKKYFQECINSLKVQELPADEIIIIDDMAGIDKWAIDYGELPIKIHRNAWLSGVAHSFNYGVALARNECVIMLGSDDMLLPWAIKDAVNTYARVNDNYGYYYFDIVYSDTNEMQRAANNCAMTTKTLWKHTGGFPVQSSIGACDHIYLSVLIGNKCGNLYNIQSEKPPYWYRRHEESVTSTGNPYFYQATGLIRDGCTLNWHKPDWGRYES